MTFTNRFIEQAGIELPVVGGAMYPCSNPELVAAISEAGGIGVIQPVALTYVHGHDFRKGIRYIKQLTTKPLGMNALIERTAKKYHEKMSAWVDIALEEGVRFFITSLGKPDWVVKRVHSAQGFVYHDVTERKWALKGIESDVDGFIAVNKRAGGHAGALSAEQLIEALREFELPILCAGGVSTPQQFWSALHLGYDGVQMGTRFIATSECNASDAYKNAIVAATEDDIVLTERVTGIPVSMINSRYIQRLGAKSSGIESWLLNGSLTKRWMRTLFTLKSIRQLKKASQLSDGTLECWSAGKSVGDIHDIAPVSQIMDGFRQALVRARN